MHSRPAFSLCPPVCAQGLDYCQMLPCRALSALSILSLGVDCEGLRWLLSCELVSLPLCWITGI